MSHAPQHEIWNPFCERIERLPPKERADIERAAAWAYYLRGGGGDPSYFDYETWLKMQERSR
ncbi:MULTISPECIES: hypothetical protein [unclassified Bradyrhizobium]|uniref:hypothetical protein n=1 Tax=unclassified Bradyrhizobium TaxID=2631580 RepID=UPI0028ED2977|nr:MULTISPECIES: hypothetical protein [unclassified Bradyrhizobium]